jgi:vanillate O-demethylase monooxygenase subunit
MPPLKDAWYLAGWLSDFPAGQLTALVILGEPVVVYRGADGAPHALEDRCPHRHAPLSKGRLEGDHVRCMYHGVKFAPDGRCSEAPGQDSIPKSVFVKRYPTVEKHGGVWVWMGKAEAADPTLVPNFVGPDDADFAVQTGRLDIEADAQLLIDNLLDVSHAPYVHERTFGRNADNVSRMIVAEQSAKTTDLPRGVRVERWIFGRTNTPGIPDEIATDDYGVNEVNAPGVFTLWTRCYEAGKERNGGEMPNETPLLIRFVGQIITPVRPGQCKLFYAAGPWRAHAHLSAAFFENVTRAFREDEDIIVAQQRTIDLGGARPMLTLRMDFPLKRYELIVRKLAAAETQGASA